MQSLHGACPTQAGIPTHGHASNPGLPSKGKGETDAKAQQVQPLGVEGRGQALIPWGWGLVLAPVAIDAHQTFEYVFWCPPLPGRSAASTGNTRWKRFLYTPDHTEEAIGKDVPLNVKLETL